MNGLSFAQAGRARGRRGPKRQRLALVSLCLIVASLFFTPGTAYGAGPVRVVIEDPATGVRWESSGVVDSVEQDVFSRLVMSAGLLELFGGDGPGLVSSPPSVGPGERELLGRFSLVQDPPTGQAEDELAFSIYPTASPEGPLVHMHRLRWMGPGGDENTWFQADGTLLDVLAEIGFSVDPAPVGTGRDVGAAVVAGVLLLGAVAWWTVRRSRRPMPVDA